MKEITVVVGPISLSMPCSDNQSLQYEQAEQMLEMVMEQFRQEFSHPLPVGVDEMIN